MQQKNAFGVKLIAAAVSLVGALALLTMGAFAWFTTSTEGKVEGISVSFVNDGTQWPFEVSKDGTTWAKELNISSLLTDGVLRPISTADLQHWYLATYNNTGSVAGFREVELSDVANIPKSRDDETQNYLLYCDIYVRTRDPETTYALRLNNPSTRDGELNVHDDETIYGTYVLWTPAWNTQTNSYSAADDAMASIRVGFQMLDTVDGNETVTNTVIYEPNANMHVGLGGNASSSALKDLVYVQDGEDGVKVNDYTVSESLLTTKVPSPAEDGGYVLVDQPVGVLQTTSSWNLTNVTQLTQWNSTRISQIGQFVDANGNPVPYGELPALANISEEKVQKIRIFFWLEGQDVDCWNQITGGSIYANLEFYGEAVDPSAS